MEPHAVYRTPGIIEYVEHMQPPAPKDPKITE